MTDRELLENAAKAAGIPPALYETRNGMVWEPDKKVWRRAWNPLTDDGDAFRLAVKLHLPVEAVIAFVAQRETDWETDPYAATRRAIVRAAAEIGKVMA